MIKKKESFSHHLLLLFKYETLFILFYLLGLWKQDSRFSFRGGGGGAPVDLYKVISRRRGKPQRAARVSGHTPPHTLNGKEKATENVGVKFLFFPWIQSEWFRIWRTCLGWLSGSTSSGTTRFRTEDPDRV